jgi:poly-gamma-glutamate capsule biosynthesis protein CapA/YwtB (metallophosphatase superfamily)
VNAGLIRVFLAGDVMTGRGIDQVLPHPGAPELREPHVRDARDYVTLAERVSGPVPRPAGPGWPWGDALEALRERDPALRVINLETSVTAGGSFAPGKTIHYRMNPANIGCLTVAGPGVCALANNHVLDFGPRGLLDTLQALAPAGLRPAGAGPDEPAAKRPAGVLLPAGGRALVYSCGTTSAGIPPGWAAGRDRPGVWLLPGTVRAAASELTAEISAGKRRGDLVIVSIHWAPNWGYELGAAECALAHALIDGGADLVHGHSSHHPRPVEVYQGRLILYGCGDLINDYEGIGGYQEFRSELRLAYFADVAAGTGELAGLELVPFRARRLRLERASADDAAWLAATLDRVSRPFGTRIETGGDGTLQLRVE